MNLLSESAAPKENENAPLNESLEQKALPPPRDLFANPNTSSLFGSNDDSKSASPFNSIPASDNTKSDAKAEEPSFLSKEKVCVRHRLIYNNINNCCSCSCCFVSRSLCA